MTLRGFKYIRVSDDEQVLEGYSITAQGSLLKRKFEEWEAECIGVYLDDGYSAKDLRRPDLQRLLKDVETLRPDFIVFWKLDRWTRKGKDWHKLKEVLDKYNVELRSAVGENLNEETAFNRFNVGLNVLLGEFERDQISERVHFVMTERHQNGLRNGSVAPYGYDLKDGKLVINQAQAVVIRKMFNLYANKMSGCRETAIILNRDPEKPDDRLWNYSSIRYALMNPAYIGNLRWNYRKSNGKPTGKEILKENTHEPIIDEVMFYRVNKEISSRVIGGRTVTSNYAFSGILRCDRCGSAMTGFSAKKTNGKHRYYRCSARARNGECSMPTIRAEKIESAFLNALDYDSEQLKKLIDFTIDSSTQAKKGYIEQLKKELDTIQRRKKKWQIAYADDAISLDELKERTKEDKQREDLIQIELLNTPKELESRWTKKEIIEQLSRIRKVFEDSNDEKAKKGFLRDLFESITIHCDVEKAHGAPGIFAEVVVSDFKLRD